MAYINGKHFCGRAAMLSILCISLLLFLFKICHPSTTSHGLLLHTGSEVSNSSSPSTVVEDVSGEERNVAGNAALVKARTAANPADSLLPGLGGYDSDADLDGVEIFERDDLSFREWLGIKWKGFRLLCQLKSSSAQPSRWTEYDQLKEWGWHLSLRADRTDWTDRAGRWWGINIGHLDDGIRIIWYHKDDTTHPQTSASGETEMITYPATKAEYGDVYFPSQGVIVATSNYGPDYEVKKRIALANWPEKDGEPLPVTELKQWSDVAFLTWQYLTTPVQRKNIRWMGRMDINNLETKKIIGEACNNKGVGVRKPGGANRFDPTWRAPAWPGAVFRASHLGADFEALLATPNSKGVVWFLRQHHADLGHRTVRSIRVWYDGTGSGYSPSMVFEIVPFVV